MNQDTLVRWLNTPAAYAERPTSVEHVETHLSHVFLTDQFAYKLKKPVRFTFVDFSNPARREQACQDEVRLNRRLAPDIYLDVLPVTQQADGTYQLGGDGPPVDWIVQMRRLPAERMLDVVIRAGQLTEAQVTQLAQFLTRFYLSAPPVALRPKDYLTQLGTHVAGNYQALLGTGQEVGEALIRRVHTPQYRLLHSRPELFADRVRAGRVVDGHGDLRPEHICLLDSPVVFDCIEFDPLLRQGDVVDELCFLAMECDRLGASHVGKAVLDSYLTQSHDAPPDKLTAFHKSYRACVRAKVAALRGAQLVGESRAAAISEAREYLTLADRYQRAADARPLLLLVTGLMGSGKSTLAKTLSDQLAAVMLRTDVIRDRWTGKSSTPEPFDQGRYRPDARQQVYEELLREADTWLEQGVSVALDGTFGQQAWREAAKKLGQRRDADVLLIECRCPRDVALARIHTRLQQDAADASEARPELYEQQSAEYESPSAAESPCLVNTVEPLTQQAAAAYQSLALLS
ncbi:MAG: AAA family ATPase [Planctomycetes bacterium]|nr:AAA family ATPase [Planctomycetota bacterium]